LAQVSVQINSLGFCGLFGGLFGVWAFVGVWASVGFCSGKYKFTSLSILADFWRYGINATYTLH
jgi:hypothetical protein